MQLYRQLSQDARRQRLTVDSARMVRSSKDMAAVLALAAPGRAGRGGAHAARAHAVRGRVPRERGRVRPRPSSTRAGRRRAGPSAGPRRASRFTFRDLPLGPLTLDGGDPRRARPGGRGRGRHRGRADRLRITCGRVRPRRRPGGARAKWSCGVEPFRAGDGRLLGVRLGRVAIDGPARSVVAGARDRCSSCSCPRCSPSSLRGWRGWPCGPRSSLALATLAFEGALLWPSGLVHSALRGAALGHAVRRVAPRRWPSRAWWRSGIPGPAPAAFVALLAGVAGSGGRRHLAGDGRERRRVPREQALRAWPRGDLFPVERHATRAARSGFPTASRSTRSWRRSRGPGSTRWRSCGWARRRPDSRPRPPSSSSCSAVVGPLAAVLSAVLLQLLPGAFDVAYSYGNFSNAFGQAATVVFFCWWAGGAPLRVGGGRGLSSPWPRWRTSRASSSRWPWSSPW